MYIRKASGPPRPGDLTLDFDVFQIGGAAISRGDKYCFRASDG